MPSNILSIPRKRTAALSGALSSAIRNYISQHYTDTHPEAFANDIREFGRLRDQIASLDTHVSATDHVLRYHAQLVFFATKFPSDVGLSFPWTLACPPSMPSWTGSISGAMDAINAAESGPQSGTSYATSDTVAHPDLNYERACVLFNLASLYSSLGCAEGRSDNESIKRATAWFQNAAGVLQHILNNLLPELYRLKPACSDLSEGLLKCVRDLMLAQAQECFWQKAVMNKLKDGTIAKLAEQVSEYYGSALEATESSTAVEAKVTLASGWASHITVKKWHFAAAAQYRKACEDLAANRYGDELGRLKLAETLVKKALDSSKRGVSEAITSDLKSLQQIIVTNIARGTRDNDLIYLEPVTNATNLAPISAAAMVKAVTPVEVSDPIPLLRESPTPALGNPLFAELVPYGVHLAISIYDDRKDSFVRDTIASRRDELDAIASSSLQSLNLPGSLQALEQPMGLPPALLRKHEEVVAQGGIDRLQRIASDVSRIAASDRQVLAETLALLDAEEREDESVRDSYARSGWTRPPSQQVNQELKAQAGQYHDTLIKAAASDDIVRQKLEDWEDLLGVLSGGIPDLEAFVPSSNPSLAAGQTSDAQVQCVRALRVELENLDDLLDSRTACLTEVKALAAADDIRPLVMREAATISTRAGTSSSSQSTITAADFEDVFGQQMDKYTRFKQEIDQSAAQQAQLLERIEERNSAFVQARKSDPTIHRREKALQNLDIAYVKYRELSSNLVEGLEFYNSLAKILGGFRDQVKEWARARQTDLHYLVDQLNNTHMEQPAVQVPPTVRPTPRRTPRKTKQPQQPEDANASPSLPTKVAPVPQWGAFPGGQIQFGDN